MRTLRRMEKSRTRVDASMNSELENGVIEHIDYDVLLSLFTPLHEAFKTIVEVNANFTNNIFREVV